ncbi:MAG TPA: LamG-like jellyroll fold domain-containing protein [Tepidisphaeraceae bacterium]|jgi:autotransporter-associated beta strand protein
MTVRIPKALIAAAAVAAVSGKAQAVLTFNVEPNGWPNATQRQAAIDAMQSAVNRYNAYGDFGNYNIYVYYNAGIPTAQSNYLGSIGFGGTYPNERVAMHEMGHYLGSGTYGTPWDGPRGEALIDQFDGIEAYLQGDTQHFWPYGLNYDSEGSEINKQRQVAMIYAERADMGIGPTAQPSSATSASLMASDPLGESSFNYAVRWSNNHFAQPGTTYSTGQFLLRTPASGNSFTFVGDSLTVNNTNGINGGLLYKGSGTTGLVTFKNLILDGGYVRHASSSADLFQLAGKVTLTGSPTIDAAQGAVQISANMGGSGSLTKIGSFPLVLSGINTYSGNTNINAGTLRLAPLAAVANYSFDNVSGSTVINTGSGGASMNGTLANGAAIVAGGRFGNAVSLSGGASVNVNNPIIDLGNVGNWTVSAWVKTTTPGASILTKGDGSGWAYGNTIFYLGDGTGQGSGGIPSGVRWAGGFVQGSAVAAPVNNNAWHLVTYVNNAGSYAVYVDGNLQPLSAGNSSFAVPDIGAVVRLGISTNTVPADGTVNYNGLLDDVRFYNQSLSAAQILALYQGQTVAPLPTTTNVSIAAGATLDVNGMVQQIGSLSGPAGSAVALGSGQLTVSSASNSQFAGTITGVVGSIVKAGAGALTLGGTNSYTGGTTVNAGSLITSSNFSNGPLTINGGVAQVLAKATPNSAAGTTVVPSFSIAAGGQLDLTNNSMVIHYAGPIGTQLQDVRDHLRNGRLTTSSGTATTRLGYGDNAILGKTSFGGVSVDSSSILIKYTYAGDSDLDGDADGVDIGTWATNFTGELGGTGSMVWTQGDWDYDGDVDGVDAGLWAQAFTGELGGAGLGLLVVNDPNIATGAAAILRGLGITVVPEPTTFLVAAGGLACYAFARRRRN